ncbi:flavodoxin [Pseudomonas fluorescens]|uniref:flavodoxin n=1 Tax=Pseudomonas fluorescens TaxID=294 RepID=UPI003748968B
MNNSHDPTRRTVMAALAALPLSGAVSAAEDRSALRLTGSRTLVAYFSRSGNTRVVAGLIHRAHNTDLFEIRPATPYPEEYLATVEQARQERDTGYEPPLETVLPNLIQYETVYLGFPIWGETTPPAIRAFLSSHDLSGKKLIPFITHGGYGLGNSLEVITQHTRNVQLGEEFVMEADRERKTMDLVTSWLNHA